LLKKFFLSEYFNPLFIKFLLINGFAGFVNFFSRFFYNLFADYRRSVILAYLTGMVVAFSFSRSFIFGKSDHGIKKEILFFILVNIAGLLQAYIISVGLAEYIFPLLHFYWNKDAIAHFIGISFPAFTSYIGHKYFTFRKKSEPPTFLSELKGSLYK